MALIKCKECGHQVSKKATACPNCGAPNKQKKAPIFEWLVAIFFGFLLVTYFHNHQGANGSVSSADATPIHRSDGAHKKTVAVPINLNVAQALDSKYGIDADAHCATGADNYLKRAAEYEFKWDHVGIFGAKFDRYLPVVPSPGVLTVSTNRVSLENGFGVYKRITLYCDYDTQAKKVLRYWMFQ